ncbi:response regulator [Mariprofundus micogutta]
MENFERVTIVLAEDDEGHARLTEKNLERAGIRNKIHKCITGSAVIDYICGEGEFAGKPHISDTLILLDLNMPIMDGYQVLEKLKSNEKTKQIPIIVLTTTDDKREIKRCYELGCNIYITKPVDYIGFSNAVRELGLFLSVVKIPNGV